jgi:hypothetical protein
MSLIALDWTYKTFPLEPVAVPAPQNLIVTQTDTNKLRITWTGRGVSAIVERNTNSTGWVTLDSEFSTPSIYNLGKEYTDTNVVDGVSYAYRITSQVGDYQSTSLTSGAFTVTNVYAGWDVVWQQMTNEYQALAIDTQIAPTGMGMAEQQVKGINTASLQISAVELNFDSIDSFTVTNNEVLQVSIYSKTNHDGVFYGTSRALVVSTNLGWRRFVFHTPVVLPAGSNFWLKVEGNWVKAQLWTMFDDGVAGYRPGEGFDIWFYTVNGFTNNLGGLLADLNFKVYIKYTPLPVSNVTTNQVADTAVTITWPDSNQGLVRYKVDQFHGSWTDDVTNTTATNVTITGLTIGETYKWRVYSYIPGQSGSESAKVESQLITLADLPIVTNTWVTSLSGGSAGSSAADTNGYKFTVGSSDIVVTDLGTYFTAGTYANTSVELLNSSCTRLAIATVPVAGSTPGAFNWAPTLGTAVTLTAGSTYHIRRNSSGFNEYLYGATPTVTTAASVISGTYNDCSNPGYTVACNFKYYVP